jgi:hypothetical protein
MDSQKSEVDLGRKNESQVEDFFRRAEKLLIRLALLVLLAIELARIVIPSLTSVTHYLIHDAPPAATRIEP